MNLKIIILYTIISFCWGITWLFLKINVTHMPILWGCHFVSLLQALYFGLSIFYKKQGQINFSD